MPVDTPGAHYELVRWLLYEMSIAVTGPNRIKGLLPKGTIVAHKTGTGGTNDGLTSATNDIGIIYLPNGKHLAVAVFVSDSPADDKTREGVIARIAKASWDRWSK
jgi:beta-lactamase class A